MIVDLYAGCGGWSEGLRLIGLSDVGIELDERACLSRAAAGHPTIRADVSTYPVEHLAGRVEGLIASPPCQSFSSAGKGDGVRDLALLHDAIEACRDGWTPPTQTWRDERTRLILEPLRWTWALRPVWVACEQVPPCLPIWVHVADVLRSWGYSADARILCAADWGVPQTRRRAFLLAHRDVVRWPEPTHAETPEPSLFGAPLKPWVSMAEALGWDGSAPIGQRRNSGPGAERDPRSADQPSYTIRSNGSGSHPSGSEWVLRGNQKPDGVDYQERGTDQPAQTVSGKAHLYRWLLPVLRHRSRTNATVRSADQPAGTLNFGHASNDVRWVRTSFGEPHRGQEAGSPKPEFDPVERPSRTVNTKTGDWTRERPATSVQGDPRIGRPGHKDREGGESQFEEDSVRIELYEAAILQGFCPLYPFQGPKTARFSAVGNAVPPPWAAAIIGALTHTETTTETPDG